jgi:hypothetical protein
MAKIVHFPNKNQNMVEQLEFILKQAKEGKLKNYAFAAELQGEEDGLIATSYCNADVGTKQLLMSHIQIDIIAAVVEVNFFEE